MKTKLQSLFIVLALLAGVYPVLAQVGLGIVPTNNQALLHWAPTATNYVLQSSTNLSPTNWVSATDVFPATYGSDTAVTVTNTVGVRYFRLKLVPATTADGMTFIPAGSFTMGDASDGSIPTNIYVSALYVDTNLVSYSKWQGVYSYATSHGYAFHDAGAGKAANHPVQTVDWYDCVKWCNARSQQAGLTPVYYANTNLTLVYTNGEATNYYANWSANGYRLPTEAEWEKSARGGLSGQRFPWGDTISWSQANYYGNPGSLGGLPYDLATANDFDPAFSGGDSGNYPYTSSVGTFAPNGYGLYDMAGNVLEWCWDWFGPSYAQPTASNPTGPATGSYHVLRGGNWGNQAGLAQCASRDNDGAPNLVSGIGLRCVRGF